MGKQKSRKRLLGEDRKTRAGRDSEPALLFS